MSFHIEQVGCKLIINKDNVPKALMALRQLEPKEFSAPLVDSDTFVTAMEKLRWEVCLDFWGAVCDIEFFGGYSHNEEVVLRQIAPFVPNNCYIEMKNEESDVWRWVFKDGELYYQTPQITWSEESLEKCLD